MPRIAVADDDPETPWPIEERCVGEPIEPPDDWTFEGTIIAEGPFGIHGISFQGDTPYVLAFQDEWIDTGGYGSLSPGGRWYAIPEGYFVDDGSTASAAGNVVIENLLIYDLTQRGQALRVPWNNVYYWSQGTGTSGFYDSQSPVWLDEDTVVYARDDTYYRIEVPSLEIQAFRWPDGLIEPTRTNYTNLSPDWTRIEFGGTLYDAWTGKHIADFYPSGILSDLPRVAWHPNSSEFIYQTSTDVAIRNRYGELLELVVNQPENFTQGGFLVYSSAYSTGGNTIWMRQVHSPQQGSPLILADRHEQVLWDTCITGWVFRAAWFSPDGEQVAILSQDDELLILEIHAWRLVRTNIYHSGEIIGWRNP